MDEKLATEYEKLKSAATKANEAMRLALRWINYDDNPPIPLSEVEQKLWDAVKLLDTWGAHP